MIVQRRTREESKNLEELKSLAEAAGYSVVGSMEQVREPGSKYQIGVGKAQELARLVKERACDKIIFDNTMKPLQEYNLAKLTGREVIDRFLLILEIFSRRASTKEALLQIQLAKLQYQLARARENVNLAKHGEQPGFYGLGKYEVDVYYDAIKRQMSHIKEELKDIRGKRSVQRSRRLASGFSLVAFAGYTNAGKTTLFNLMAGENKAVGSKLFTTLTTTIRSADLQNKKVLLIDTVGFIDRLPVQLVEAFQSTLEETIFSDAVILVVDGSELLETIKMKLETCLRTIRNIGAQGIPIITTFNKMDLVSTEELVRKERALEQLTPSPIFISALKQTNIEALRIEVARRLEVYSKLFLKLPIGDKSLGLVSWLHEKTYVKSISYSGKFVEIDLEAPFRLVEVIRGKCEKAAGNMRTLINNY
ncbi:GTPase HflX [Candidatus Bathyarchaeota archaeon RBG_16_48_13]|nr:MAG: GTPase HflX [Candidatus Bathyarchaeota archaeon RBG_16_48_13]